MISTPPVGAMGLIFSSYGNHMVIVNYFEED